MKLAPIVGFALAFSATAGCSFVSPDQDLAYVDSWDEYAPHARLVIETAPAGALVELYSERNEWCVIGSTPGMQPLSLEATGKTYLVRITKEGYFNEVLRVSLQGGDRNIRVPLRRDDFHPVWAGSSEPARKRTEG